MDPVSLKCCVDGKGKADCTQTVQLAGHRAGALEGPSQGLLPVASRTLRVGGVPHPPHPPARVHSLCAERARQDS